MIGKAKYIGYIPTGRAASTSLRNAFKNCGLLDADFIWDVPNKHGFFVTRVNRSGQDFLFPRWWEGESGMSQTSMFTVVRNPYDRVVSGWLHSKKQGWIPDSFSLYDYMWLLSADWSSSWSEFYADKQAIDSFKALILPQLKGNEEIGDIAGEMLASAVNHGMNWQSSTHTAVASATLSKKLLQVCMKHITEQGPPPAPFEVPILLRPNMAVIRFEDLSPGMDELCKAYGFPKLDIPALNMSPNRRDYRHYYQSDEEVEFVKNYYSLELSMFDYTFDG